MAQDHTPHTPRTRRSPRSPSAAPAAVGVAARQAAVTLVHNVTVLGQPLDPMLDRILAGLSPSDRALARALAGWALRNLPGLDALIDGTTARRLPDDARARQVLRVALAGHLLLETPAHAAIATALPLVAGGPRRLVHGILSRLIRERATLPPPALPGPWAEHWRQTWGAGVVAAATRRFAMVPPTDLTLAHPADTAGWAERLAGISLAPGHVRLPGSQTVADLAGYAEGQWWVQDVAASLPARLLGDVAGRSVLDLCAAPGGKTMQLAAAGARVTALDQSARRMQRLAANLARVGLSAELVVADLLEWQPDAAYDAILLDAPCSATGTFGRHPDLLYVRKNLDVAPLVARQQQMLARAAGWLKPGGLLVYAVCSLEPEEGERQPVPPGLTRLPVTASELPAGLLPDAQGAIRTLPTNWQAEGGADGFYIACFRKE